MARVKWGEENERRMENNVMREIGIVMGTWYVAFAQTPRQRRQKFFLLPLEHRVGFPRRGRDDAAK